MVSALKGFDVQTDLGTGRSKTADLSKATIENSSTKASASLEKAPVWIRQYQRLAKQEQAPSQAKPEFDGRTIHGLEMAKRNLVAAGVPAPKAAEMALNRLAAYRKSKSASPEVQRAKAVKRASRRGA